MESTIYDMKLHEYKFINDEITVLRVSGGWLYFIDIKSPVFVPYNNEFQNI
jgi:hypothetical protein